MSSESNLTISSVNTSEFSELSQSALNSRFVNPDAFSKRTKNKFHRQFLCVCSSVYKKYNGALESKEIRQKFKSKEINIPNFEDWFRIKSFVVWNKLNNKLELSTDELENESSESSEESSESSEESSEASSGREENNNRNSGDVHDDDVQHDVYDDDEQQDVHDDEQHDVHDEDQHEARGSPLHSSAKYGKKNGPKKNARMRTTQTLSNNEEKSKQLKEKKDSEVLNAAEKKELGRLNKSFAKNTGSPIEDASFDVKNILGCKYLNKKRLYKIDWGPEYEPTWETESILSCRNKLVKFHRKKNQKYIGPDRKRPYVNEEVRVKFLPKKTQKIADDFFQILNKGRINN